VVDEIDQEEKWAVRMDGWIPWEAEGEGWGVSQRFYSSSFLLSYDHGGFFCSGESYPAHSATLRWRIFFVFPYLLATVFTDC
jgi:hypothetical protein